MDEQKQQLIDRIKQAQNILVTVSSNPSVDQLSAAIGLTIALNKLGKHGTAVFSGEVPSTIDFLKPEDTLEKNTDSLRDFIIALDKSKADKLRYKVEDQVVRIFITPYKTSISEKDLDFSQGDFNVDVVVCLGVTDPADLDTAITSHGRILHDATVVSVSTVGQGSLGTINWVDPTASSLSEMVVALNDGLDKKLLDGQIATALLTGIVASTERFSNDKTSPKTMSASAELMAAGANQQLIATQLETLAEEKPADLPPSGQPEQLGEKQDSAEQDDSGEDKPRETPKPEPGMLEIDHEGSNGPAEPEEPATEPPKEVHVDEDGQLRIDGADSAREISRVRGVPSDGVSARDDKKEASQNDTSQSNGAQLTANSTPEKLDPSTAELSLPPPNEPFLTHNETTLSPAPAKPEPVVPNLFTPPPAPTAAPPAWQPPKPVTPDETLAEIEQSVASPHLQANDSPPAASAEKTVDSARDAVEAAFKGVGAPADPLQPIAALNAQPLGQDLRNELANEAPAAPAAAPFSAPTPPPPATSNAFPNTGFSEPTPGNTPADDALDMPLPSNPFGPGQTSVPSPFTPPPPANTPQTPPSAFPSVPQQGTGPVDGQTPPPPVPPPMLPPLQ